MTSEDVKVPATVYEPLDEVAQTCRIFSTRHAHTTQTSMTSTNCGRPTYYEEPTDCKTEPEPTHATACDPDEEPYLEINLTSDMAKSWLPRHLNAEGPFGQDEYLVIQVPPKTPDRTFNIKTVSEDVRCRGVTRGGVRQPDERRDREARQDGECSQARGIEALA